MLLLSYAESKNYFKLRLMIKNKEYNNMTTGTVKWFNFKKGYGFIAPEQGGDDVFVHITAVQAAGIDGLDENDKVSYDLEDSNGKQSAVNLQKI
jgi:cold shock protein